MGQKVKIFFVAASALALIEAGRLSAGLHTYKSDDSSAPVDIKIAQKLLKLTEPSPSVADAIKDMPTLAVQ